jgi:glutamyl-Q tRNA(Asp) synthetase
VAAVGAWLFARQAGGEFLVRIEDLDRAREVKGSADEILRALGRFGLESDREVVFQTRRSALYEAACGALRHRGLLFPCACTRAELSRVASAPAPDDPADEEPISIYPGTCRSGLPEGRAARCLRFRAPAGPILFEDAVCGVQEQDVAAEVGDFVVQRADGPFAYQLAVVVDDAAQGVTQVVRGGDLLSSAARQIALQRALSLPTPRYAHLPVVVGPDGAKLGKRTGALPLDSLDERRVRASLSAALSILGQGPVDGAPNQMLAQALVRFDPASIPKGSVQAPAF